MLDRWEPEDEQFWEQTGKKVANRTLWITTVALFLSFATWFMWSVIIIRLPGVGFKLTDTQQFWLVAMPGLSGATLRIPYSFIVQKFGTRKVVTFATASLIIPVIGAAWVVQNPSTPYPLLMFLAFLAGFGGGNFAAFMSSTSYFFPKKKQGAALGIQAGIGNFGVSATQFLVPVVITSAMFGTLFGVSQPFKVKGEFKGDIFLQNSALIYALPIILVTIAAAIWLRDVPVSGSISSQFSIFKRKHNWVMTSLYFMTFGTFIGLSASFPKLIEVLFKDLPSDPIFGNCGGCMSLAESLFGKASSGAPNPVYYAFFGPLIGSAVRPLGGWISDKVGGGIVTQICAISLLAGTVAITFFTTTDNFTMFFILMLTLFFAAGIGNGSTFRQIPIIFDPKEAGPVLGWTSAIAAYGSFLFPVFFGWSIASTGGSPNTFFFVMVIFYVANIFLNWYYYTRKNAEVHC